LNSIRFSNRLQGVIHSRLSQLTEPARKLADIAATIGREFTTAVLARASEADSGSLVRSR
jgi:predicted ATPase